VSFRFVSRGPDQYYYKETKRCKRYFTHIGNKSNAKNIFDKTIIDSIQPYDNNIDVLRMYEEKKRLRTRIRQLRKQMDICKAQNRKIDTDINGHPKPNLSKKLEYIRYKFERERQDARFEVAMRWPLATRSCFTIRI
jgi:hypothetical protein